MRNVISILLPASIFLLPTFTQNGWTTLTRTFRKVYVFSEAVKSSLFNRQVCLFQLCGVIPEMNNISLKQKIEFGLLINVNNQSHCKAGISKSIHFHSLNMNSSLLRLSVEKTGSSFATNKSMDHLIDSN